MRFATLGMLEFIDWGGGDILYYASRYLTEALGDDALRRARHRRAQHGRGPHRPEDGRGFLDYEGLDVDAYRRRAPAAFVALLRHLGLMQAAGGET